MDRKKKRSYCSSQVYDSRQSTPPISSTNEAEDHRQPVSVGEGNEMPDKKKMKTESFEQVKDQATFSGFQVLPPANHVQTPPAQVHLSPASVDNSEVDVRDESDHLIFDKKGRLGHTQQVNIRQKRKRSSPSAQLYDSSESSTSSSSSHSSHSYNLFECTTSTSSSDVAEYHQSDEDEDEDDEGPERKKRQKGSVEDVFSLFFNQRGFPGQGQQVPLYWRNAEKQNLLQDISCAEADSGPQELLSKDENNILSRYEIGRKLGEGGFGAVYEGKRLADGLQDLWDYVYRCGDSLNEDVAQLIMWQA